MEETAINLWWTNPGWYVAGLLVAGAFAQIFMWVGAINTERKEFKEFIKDVGNKLDRILGTLKLSTVAGGSPLHLTDLGREVADELNVNEWADEKAADLFKTLRDKKEYKIHQFSLNWMDSNFKPDDDLNDQILSCAYARALTKSDILKVYAVVLRDKLVEMAEIESLGLEGKQVQAGQSGAQTGNPNAVAKG